MIQPQELAFAAVDQSTNDCDDDNTFPIPPPTVKAQMEWKDNEPKVIEKSVAQKVKPQKIAPSKVKKVVQTTPVEEQLIEESKFVEKIEDQMPNEVEEEIIVPVMKPMKIRITYKRGHESIVAPENEMLAKQEPASATSRLKNMFASARDIKPGNLLADIRDVKNDFLREATQQETTMSKA